MDLHTCSVRWLNALTTSSEWISLTHLENIWASCKKWMIGYFSDNWPVREVLWNCILVLYTIEVGIKQPDYALNFLGQGACQGVHTWLSGKHGVSGMGLPQDPHCISLIHANGIRNPCCKVQVNLKRDVFKQGKHSGCGLTTDPPSIVIQIWLSGITFLSNFFILMTWSRLFLSGLHSSFHILSLSDIRGGRLSSSTSLIDSLGIVMEPENQ